MELRKRSILPCSEHIRELEGDVLKVSGMKKVWHPEVLHIVSVNNIVRYKLSFKELG